MQIDLPKNACTFWHSSPSICIRPCIALKGSFPKNIYIMYFGIFFSHFFFITSHSYFVSLTEELWQIIIVMLS